MKMKAIEQFVRLAKYAGERFDLTQAGGGNVSVKLENDLMLIKESGYSLSEIELDKGYTRITSQKVLNILRNKRLLLLKNKEQKDNFARRLLKNATKDSHGVPSIEIFLHVLLATYTLHIHPLAINAITCRKDWKKILKRLSLDGVAMVDYRTPGIELALALQKVIEAYRIKYRQNPKVIFLQNHGLIVSADDTKGCIEILESLLERAEKFLKINLTRYKLTNRISEFINSLENTYNVSYVSSDDDIQDFLIRKRGLFVKRPFCPDGVVYCGPAPLEISSLKDKKPLRAYRQKYSLTPRMVIYKNNVFFIAQNIKKAREIEDVLKSNLLTLDLAKDRVNFLDRQEIEYLSTWKAERYRRTKD